MRLRTLGALLSLFVLGACGTHLNSVDTRALLNEQRAAKNIEMRTDAGAVVSLAEAIYCSAGGTLRRAGKPSDDGGIPCPDQMK